MRNKTMAVIGGKLQGVEATYLARKAGWRVLLIDTNPNCPASGLCDDFLPLDVTQKKQVMQLKTKVDLLLPALENTKALDALSAYEQQLDIPVVFDCAAYGISSSKKSSNNLFAKLGLPSPAIWPNCRPPVIAKPVSASGSENVHILSCEQDIEHFCMLHRAEDWIVQEFVPGPSYSIEVLGWKGRCHALTVTDLAMDEQYDCCRVTAPTVLSQSLVTDFRNISEHIASAIGLNGIMDVEVIAADSGLKLLEIDARLPSQTPTAVYWSTGLNMVEQLADLYLGTRPALQDSSPKMAVIYEHIQVTPAGISTHGEHIMAETGPLQLRSDFFGADEAITNYAPAKSTWVATLIMSGRDLETAWRRREKILELIEKSRGLSQKQQAL